MAEEYNKTSPSKEQSSFVAVPTAFMESTIKNEVEIELSEVIKAIWQGKLLIILVTFLFAVLSVYYALSQPDVYRAKTVLAPASSDSNSAGGLLSGQLSGLAGMAGISLSSGSTDKVTLALEVMQSRNFLESFINRYDVLVPLLASEGWNHQTNELVYNEEDYSSNESKWIREVSYPKKVIPSDWEAYVHLLSLLNVERDLDSGIITISIDHYSPELAVKWLSFMIHDINSFMREKDKKEAQDSIDFLQSQLEKTSFTDMQNVFYQLIEEQMKTIMLTEISRDYVFRFIDEAAVPDERASPNRVIICVLGTLGGGFLAVIIALVRYFTRSKAT